MKTLLTVLLFLTDIPAYSQTFCTRFGDSIVCNGDTNRTITPLGRDSGVITDDRGISLYRDGVIIEGESQSYRDAQRRSEERRREMIYGDDRDRNESRSRSRRGGEDER